MPRLKTEETTTLSLRIPVRLYDAIGESAERDGMTRTDYVLSWLPDSYTSKSPTALTEVPNNHR